jgi:hypothetical protein
MHEYQCLTSGRNGKDRVHRALCFDGVSSCFECVASTGDAGVLRGYRLQKHNYRFRRSGRPALARLIVIDESPSWPKGRSSKTWLKAPLLAATSPGAPSQAQIPPCYVPKNMTHLHDDLLPQTQYRAPLFTFHHHLYDCPPVRFKKVRCPISSSWRPRESLNSPTCISPT